MGKGEGPPMAIFLEELSLLVVEPSHAQQMILRDHLEHLGIRSIRTVESLQEATVELRAFAPHLVLSAMHLPDGRGSDLLSLIRKDDELAELPFILISSETRRKELEPIRQGGAVAILPKPYSRDSLLSALRDTVDLLHKDALDLEGQQVEDIRALVVDDSRTSRRFVIQVLNQLGIEHVTEAADGLEAVTLLSEKFFDLVLTDFNMPNMDGHQLLEHIRKESPQPNVPVLMITSERNGARIAGVERAGVSAIVDKPFEIQRVRTIIRNVLS